MNVSTTVKNLFGEKPTKIRWENFAEKVSDWPSNFINVNYSTERDANNRMTFDHLFWSQHALEI